MEQRINLEELEEEALEVNRLFMSWQMLRTQHRERVMEALKDMPMDNSAEIKRLAEIMMRTVIKEEGV